MAITKRYETERECTRCFVNELYDNVDSNWFLYNPEAAIYFYGMLDSEDGFDEDDPEYGELGETHCPMWSTWFHPNDSFEERWIEDNKDAVAQLGFTVIYVLIDGCEDMFLGIDGAGFDFYESFWIPLYRLHGFTWHEER